MNKSWIKEEITKEIRKYSVVSIKEKDAELNSQDPGEINWVTYIELNPEEENHEVNTSFKNLNKERIILNLFCLCLLGVPGGSFLQHPAVWDILEESPGNSPLCLSSSPKIGNSIHSPSIFQSLPVYIVLCLGFFF